MNKLLYITICLWCFLFFLPVQAGNVIVKHPRENVKSDTTNYVSVFLAGTIDNGASIDWQQNIVDKMRNFSGNFLLYNPRRSVWDANDKRELEYQINWELDHLEAADYILMNILGSSKSPVSLLELGIHIHSGKILLVCDPSYYRYDNVRITCKKYHVKIYHTIEEALQTIQLWKINTVMPE